MKPLVAFEFAVPQQAAAGFQQIERADDVGVDEIARPGDGAVHMRFRRQVHDMGDGVLLHDPQRRRSCRADPPFQRHIWDVWKPCRDLPDGRRR